MDSDEKVASYFNHCTLPLASTSHQVKDFDEKVVNKICLLVDMHGAEEALAMLSHLEHRMRTKQGVMKNGPGYLDVAVSSHLDMLKVREGAALDSPSAI